MLTMETEQDTQTISTIMLNKGIRLRNTQKGYTWDIVIPDYDLEKLNEINQRLINDYGQIKIERGK